MEDKEEKESIVKLRVVEALQDDAYRGIARIDPTLMKKLKKKWNLIKMTQNN